MQLHTWNNIERNTKHTQVQTQTHMYVCMYLSVSTWHSARPLDFPEEQKEKGLRAVYMHHALFLLPGKQCQFMRETILKRNANLFVVILKLCYNMMKAVSKNNSRFVCWVCKKYPSMVEI